MAHGIAGRIAGEQGEASVDLAVDAIRSVATGVLGVASLQAILAAIGLVLADVPAAGLWTVLVLILAVAQLPPLVVLGPAIAYVIATSDSTLTQVLFTLWSLLVSVSDAFLKPLFLGRGLSIPMPVILIGAIGGVIRAGLELSSHAQRIEVPSVEATGAEEKHFDQGVSPASLFGAALTPTVLMFALFLLTH